MAEKQTNKDRMREIVDSIENGIKELFESDIPWAQNSRLMGLQISDIAII